MAETTGLLNRRTGNTVPRVRIPPSPQITFLVIAKAELVVKILCTGYSVVRLARLLWEQEVAGSNPATPTLNIKPLRLIL